MLDRQVSAMDGTNKFLFRLSDGHVVESVLMNISMAILFVSPPRLAAGWDVGFVPRRSEDLSEISRRQKCLDRSIRFREFPVSVLQML